VFQDDVDVRPDTLPALASVARWLSAPVLTGHDAAEHRAENEITSQLRMATVAQFATRRTAARRICNGRRDYWQSRNADSHAHARRPEAHDGRSIRAGGGEQCRLVDLPRLPNSVVAQGGYVVCVPGLVRTFYSQAKDSTWNNAAPHGEEPPLCPS